MAAGREPLKNKRYEVLKDTANLNDNKFAISEAQAAYLNQNDLVHRFIHKRDYEKNNNFHRSGWRVIPDPDLPGCNADGLVEIGDVVLAVKTREASRRHKEQLANKNRIYSDPKAVQKKVANELRQSMKEVNLSGRIHEGYEDNDTGADSGDDE